MRLRRRLRRSQFSRVVIYPYKMGSRSAKQLALHLTTLLGSRVRRIKPNGTYRPRHSSIIINYGSSHLPVWWGQGTYINPVASCTRSGNKLSALRQLKESGIPIPEFTTDRNTALQWISDRSPVVCRTILNGHSGRGIVMAESPEQLVYAPLYTRYKKKKKEFRVHVFKGQVIDIAEKRRSRQVTREQTIQDFVRNHINGWIFCRTDIQEPAGLRELAIRATQALELDFGACDIIWNEHENMCYVLEVNTAPGVEGTTLERYATAIANYVRSI